MAKIPRCAAGAPYRPAPRTDRCKMKGRLPRHSRPRGWRNCALLIFRSPSVADPLAGRVRRRRRYERLCCTSSIEICLQDISDPAEHKGDHVIPLYTAGERIAPCVILGLTENHPECRECKFCKSGKTNLCGKGLHEASQGNR